MKKKSARKKLPAKRAAPPKRKVQPIPAGYTAVTPYLAVRGAAQAIEFYQRAFGAKETMRMPGPGGMIGHAEVTIGGSYVMLADEYEPMGFLSPQARGCTTVHIHLYVRDVDASVARATAAGARVVRPVEDQFYGDRSGSVEDPFGHVWHIATRKVDLTKAELKKRAAEMAKGA